MTPTRPPIVAVGALASGVPDRLLDALATHAAAVTAHPLPALLATDAGGIDEALRALRADVLLLDCGAEPDHDAVDALAAAASPVPVVVVCDDDRDATWQLTLRNGCAGYVLHDPTGAEIVAAVLRAGVGDTVLDPLLSGRLARRVSEDETSGVEFDRWQLKPREREVLLALADGCTNAEIAARLVIGEETVRTHLRTAYRKIGARNRTHAIALVNQART